MPGLVIVGAGFDIQPIVGSPPTSGSGGPAYPLQSSLYVSGVGFQIEPLLGGFESDLLGEGGPAYPPQTSLFTTGVGFLIQPATTAATLTLTVPDPVLAPRTVRAVVSILPLASNMVLEWGDGEQTLNDTDEVHAYLEGGTKLVTFSAYIAALDIDVLVSESVTLPNALPEPEEPDAEPTLLGDYTEIPRESRAEALNLTLGRHGYEHTYAMHFPVDRNTIRRRNLVSAQPSQTTEVSILSFVPARDVVIRSCEVDTDGDGQFILRVGGVTEGTIYVSRQRGRGNLVGRSSIPVPLGIRVEVLVKNTGVNSASFRASLLAEQSSLGAL